VNIRCKDYKGKVADTVVFQVDTGLLAELRSRERQAVCASAR